ncbi:predicted protein [Coccidioides posadasii str. Silveira]|uniref:Predicted protein n=2 Tax=Coccidioides posadasii TaxID=199306 RepID=E9DJD2_COCPS|nr:predicted protein [Coccidioides posadasii str. Silveira]KMM66516.1 hypothetical protein CPAG_02855 [Coccidioides posadasii RMSCC 3488]
MFRHYDGGLAESPQELQRNIEALSANSHNALKHQTRWTPSQQLNPWPPLFRKRASTGALQEDKEPNKREQSDQTEEGLSLREVLNKMQRKGPNYIQQLQCSSSRTLPTVSLACRRKQQNKQAQAPSSHNQSS